METRNIILTINDILLTMITTAAIIILVFDFTGFIEKEFTEEISSITLFLLCLLILSLILERRIKLEEIKTSISRELKNIVAIEEMTNKFFYIEKNIKNNLFLNRAEELINKTRSQLSSIANGKIISNKEDFSLLLDLTDGARNSIEATSYIHNVEWWNSEFGKKYLARNKKAIQRGVKITRIFIFSNSEIKKGLDGLNKILKEQNKLGVNVLIVKEEELNPYLCEDFLIIDSNIIFIEELTHAGKTKGNMVSVNKVDIEKMKNIFDNLFICAKKYDISEYLNI